MAGLLGDIFSTVDTAKRKLTDLLGNPVLSAQQIIGNMNDRARVLNQLTAGAAQERDIYGPKSQQLANMIADAYNPMGMMVYHGSPAKFSRFDPTKIGSGEGAQSYGYGHYVAQSPEVARGYQESLSGGAMKMLRAAFSDDPELWVAGQLYSKISKPDIKEGLQILGYKGNVNKLIKSAENRMKNELNVGSFYEIDLPDEQIAKMLDWDKPLSQQPKNVKDSIRKTKEFLPPNAMDDLGGDLSLLYGKNVTPNEFLNTWESLTGKIGSGEEALRNTGVPGIRYLDQGSRGTGQGTSNFVVFPGNEDLLRILKRNEDPLGLLAP